MNLRIMPYSITSRKTLNSNLSKMKTSKTDFINNPVRDELNNCCFMNCYPNNFISFTGKNKNYDDYLNTSQESVLTKQEEKIFNLFINPVQNDDETPNAMLIYGVDESENKNFVNKTVKKSDIKLIEIEPEFDYFPNNIKKELSNARERYIQTGQRTAILLNNPERFLKESKINKENIRLMKTWLRDCAKIPSDDIQNASAATFIFTTSNPKEISPEILNQNNIRTTITLPPSSEHDVKETISSFMDELSPDKTILDEDEIDTIAQKLASNEEEGGFTKSKIKAIFENAYNDTLNNEDTFFENLSNRIARAKRNITSRTVKSSKENLKWLNKNGFTDKIELKSISSENFEGIITKCMTHPIEMPNVNELSDTYNENSASIELLSNKDYKNLKEISVQNQSIIDFWLDLQGADEAIKSNQRLKNMWFEENIQNQDRANSLITKTLDTLQKENELIGLARKAYCDIIENDETITDEQKEILIQQEENKLFYKVVTDGVSENEIYQLEINTLETLSTLAKEKETVSKNAQENIFSPAQDYSVLLSDNPDDNSITSYILQLLQIKAEKGNIEEKIHLVQIMTDFEEAKEIGDEGSLEENWLKLVKIAQETFEDEELNYLTDRNIFLLNSINEKTKDIKDNTILNLIKNPNLTIEQKEFTARYANNKNFRLMLENQNIDPESAIKELVFYEAGNRSLVDNSGLKISDNEFEKIMSDKFKQINHDSKDINVQASKIVSKLEEIKSSINAENQLINRFADSFSDYAASSLILQNEQLNQLVQMGDNISEIKQYTQALTRTKLVELEKDKYYKDIVPEITKLLPEKEQIDLKDFLSEADTLAKKEKNSARKRKIIKAAAIIAGTAATATGVYFLGSEIVAHLASKLPANIAMQTMAQTAANTNVAEKLGSGLLIPNFKGQGTQKEKDAITTLNSLNSKVGTRIANQIKKDPHVWSEQEINNAVSNADRKIKYDIKKKELETLKQIAKKGTSND